MRLCLYASLATLLFAARMPAEAQSLGDLAKQEAERRKSVQSAVKVLTNKDVPVVIQSAPPVGPDPAPGTNGASDSSAGADKDGPAPSPDKAAEAAAAEAKAAADAPKDQKYWSDRQKLLRDQLAGNEAELQALAARVNVLTVDFINRNDPVQRSAIALERQKALEEVTRLNAAIAADKITVTDFEEEARRASVPPGWLR